MSDRATNPRTPGPAAAGVAEWRRSRLRQAGFDAAKAVALAGDERWDLHALLELVDRGCPPELAERIVAPLDPEGASG